MPECQRARRVMRASDSRPTLNGMLSSASVMPISNSAMLAPLSPCRVAGVFNRPVRMVPALADAVAVNKPTNVFQPGGCGYCNFRFAVFVHAADLQQHPRFNTGRYVFSTGVARAVLQGHAGTAKPAGYNQRVVAGVKLQLPSGNECRMVYHCAVNAERYDFQRGPFFQRDFVLPYRYQLLPHLRHQRPAG